MTSFKPCQRRGRFDGGSPGELLSDGPHTADLWGVTPQQHLRVDRLGLALDYSPYFSKVTLGYRSRGSRPRTLCPALVRSRAVPRRDTNGKALFREARFRDVLDCSGSTGWSPGLSLPLTWQLSHGSVHSRVSRTVSLTNILWDALQE